MSDNTNTQDQSETGPSKPVKEHEWLKNLLGEWRTESEMIAEPGGEPMKSSGTESVRSLNGLWAYAEGKADMPGGEPMEYYFALGYDLSFKEYRGSWIANVSSHLWKYTGELSADGKTMTLNCEGPDMMSDDGGTANYRDVHEIIDENHRTMTSFGQDNKTGEWGQFQVVHFYRK